MKLILFNYSKLFGGQFKKLHMAMILSLLLGLLSVTNVTASVYSQNDKITIQADDMRLRDLFREIENNSEYAFFFNDQFAQLDTKVSFVSKNEKIDHIMGRLLKDTQLDYKMLDNNFIVIVPKETQQEQLVIKGNVTDASGAAIPGANVLEKGTNNGAVTDIDGNFTLRVLSSESILVVSFLGYLAEEITVGNQTNIKVSLVENIETLNEVVVVGYGSMQRSNVTGSISSIKADDLKKSPTPNAIEAMRGLVPGVRITRNSGQPGTDVDITIRGVKSLGTTNDKNSESYINPNSPLVVVDGVPVMGGKVSDINPNDIASMDILKDAAATSIYGSSAANGVVLITTKTGISGKPTITLNASTGYETFAMRPTLFNGKEYTQLKIDAATYQSKPTRYVTNPITPKTPQEVLDPYEYQNYLNGQERDWIDYLTRTGRTNQYGLSITGGTDKFHYYMNGDIYTQKPVIPYTDYNRYSFRANADYNAYKWLTVGVKSQATLTDANETGTAFGPNGLADFSNYTSASPLGRSEDSLGNLVPTVNSDQFQYNPIYRYEHSEVKRKNSRISVEPFLEIKFFDGLTYRINGFAEFRNERWTRWLDGMYDPQNIGNNYYKMDFGQGSSYLCDNILNFNRTFLEKHSVNLTAVYGFQTNNQENFVFEVRQNMINYLGIYDIVNADPFAENAPSTYTRQINPTLSAKAYYVGRLVYSYDNRYVVTISRRWDYTSQFGPNQRKGIFPSYAVAWNASNEKFIQNIPLISNLKLRFSYGEVGNDRIKQFSYLFTAANATYAFDGNSVSGWSSAQTGNYSLHWETSKQINMGFDFGLYKNRLNGSFDYYRARNEGLLFEKQVPIIYGDQDPANAAQSGYVPSNVAETKSWGYGLLLNGKILDGDLKWSTTINWSKDKNEIVNLGADNVDANGKPIDDQANGWYIGQDINAVYDYNFQGIYQLADTAELRRLHPDKAYYWAGDPKIADIDGNDTIDENDRTFQGSTVTPDWYGGINNTFSYKGFEFSFLFESVHGIKKYNGFLPNPLSGIRANSAKVNYWMPDNPDGDFPRPRSGSYDYGSALVRGVTSGNAVRLEDASFICLRTVALSYTLPQKLTSKVHINGLTLYVRGNNLKYWTKMKQCFSPESDYGVFPVTRNVTLGLTMTL
jgi:TonB-dependent starch-binding outer membrane protein SusC